MKRIYPPEGRTVFDGGLNNKFERSIILDNESPDCANVVFSNGSVATREGIQKLNTTAVGSFVGDGLYTRRTSTGAESMVGFWGGTAWVLNTSTFVTISSAQSVFTAGVRVATAQYQDYMFVGNGGVTPYKYNGAFTRHGVPAPTTTMTVASNAAGPLTGDYQYQVTYVNSQLVEGNISPTTTTFTAAAATLRVSAIPTAPQSHGVNQRRLYRTTAGGTTFKRVAVINDNTTTQYDDIIADSALGANAPTDNGEPPVYSSIVYHQNRLFCNDASNPNFVWYSNINEPFTFSALNFRRIGDDTGDLVKGLSVYNNSIVVYCEKSIYFIVMPDADPNNWQDVKVKSQYGSKSLFGTFDFNNKQMFPAMQNDKFVGFSQLNGNAVQQDATFLTVATAGSEVTSERIEPDMFQVQDSMSPSISSIVFQNKAYITLPFGSGATRNNRVYIFDFSVSNISKKQEASWVPWTNLNFSQFTIYGGNLYGQSSIADGFVHKLNTGVYNDNGVAIDSYFWTKEFVGYKQDVNNHKDFRECNLLVDLSGDWFMNLLYRVDSDSGVGNAIQIDLDPGGSLWGTMVWGSDLWGGGQAQRKLKEYLGTASGNRIQFRFDNQNVVNQRFKVHWANYSYNLKGVR